MKKVFKGKILLKLFLITSLTFTTLLLCALFAQSYFYRRSDVVYRKSDFEIACENLIKELRRSNTNPETVAQILINYQNRYGLWATIFLDDNVTEKYRPGELTGYAYSVVFEDAIVYYKDVISVVMNSPNTSPTVASLFSCEYMGEDFKLYSMTAVDCFANGQILLMLGPQERFRQVPLIDPNYVYIVMVGITVSLILSYIFSNIVLRPLVKIKNAAMRMAALDFTERINPISNDELGQLSDSINTMSEKLDATLNDLTAANTKLAMDIEKERQLEISRKEFVANVSHELKTPLAIIKGYAEALRDNIRADKKDHYIRSIIRETDDMNKLVQNMLDLSHIEDGHYKLQMDSFDLIALTHNVLNSMQFLIDEKNVSVHWETCQSPIYLYADRLKIGQVMTNFVHNAIRHVPKGGNLFICITESGNAVRFSIENVGKNIDNDKIEKIWDRFYRGEEHRNKKNGGTGLGLAISATILKLHCMSYGVDNTDRGVIFYFTGSNHTRR